MILGHGGLGKLKKSLGAFRRIKLIGHPVKKVMTQLFEEHFRRPFSGGKILKTQSQYFNFFSLSDQQWRIPMAYYLSCVFE